MRKRWILPLITAALIMSGCGETVADNIKKNPKPETEPPSQIETQTQEEQLQESQAQENQTQSVEETEGYDFTVRMTGDISLDENTATAQRLDKSENGIYDCLSPELIELMQQADICCVNNEFTYSTRGKPTSGKAYTFRADPSRVEVLKELGVDVAGLANNHSYDYGKDSMLDTLDTLTEAGIPYFGAGRNLEEAMKPLYVEVQGRKVAFVAASCAEKNKKTPQATDKKPGILRCYDDKLFLQEIAEARKEADFVIAYVHWGDEYSANFSKEQQKKGYAYLDAGADAVVGAHSHCLQGMEFYNGKPIVYSLGNYWFNSKKMDTMMIELRFVGNQGNENLEVRVIPAKTGGAYTQYISEAKEQTALFDYLTSISKEIVIASDGQVMQAQ